MKKNNKCCMSAPELGKCKPYKGITKYHTIPVIIPEVPVKGPGELFVEEVKKSIYKNIGICPELYNQKRTN